MKQRRRRLLYNYSTLRSNFYFGLALAIFAVIVMISLIFYELNTEKKAVRTFCRQCERFCRESGIFSHTTTCTSCCQCTYSNKQNTIEVFSAGNEMYLKKNKVGQGKAVCDNIIVT